MGCGRGNNKFMITPQRLLHVRRQPFLFDQFDFVFYAKNDSNYSRALPMQFELVSRNEFVTDPAPSFSLNPGEAQKLMDDLWREGLRPTEGTGSAGSLAATERHLQDLRNIVFKLPAK